MSDEKKELPASAIPGEDRRKTINWEPIERVFKTSTLSISEIAHNFDIHIGTLSRHAKQQGWERDIDALVRREVKRKLAGLDPQSLDQATDQSIGMGVAVTREHRSVIAQGRDLTHRILLELKDCTVNMDKVLKLIDEEAAAKRDNSGAYKRKLQSYVSIGTRAGVMRDLANASRIWVSLERTVHGLQDKSDDQDTEIAATLERLKKVDKPNSE